ncbi:hypothetical protein BGX34_008460, partial [Mortierella sp. NVP85]
MSSSAPKQVTKEGPSLRRTTRARLSQEESSAKQPADEQAPPSDDGSGQDSTDESEQDSDDQPMDEDAEELTEAMSDASLSETSLSREEAHREIEIELERLTTKMEEWNFQQAHLHIQLARLPGSLDQDSASKKKGALQRQLEKVKSKFKKAEEQCKMYEGFRDFGKKPQPIQQPAET